jgi:hypothetical protein
MGMSPGVLQSPDDRGGWGAKALIWIKRRTQTNGRNAQLFVSLRQIACSLFA